MPEVTYFVALAFAATQSGIAPIKANECNGSRSAVMYAKAFSRRHGHVGALAFSRTGDPATGDFRDAKIIRKFGTVPEDLSRF